MPKLRILIVGLLLLLLFLLLPCLPSGASVLTQVHGVSVSTCAGRGSCLPREKSGFRLPQDGPGTPLSSAQSSQPRQGLQLGFVHILFTLSAQGHMSPSWDSPSVPLVGRVINTLGIELVSHWN